MCHQFLSIYMNYLNDFSKQIGIGSQLFEIQSEPSPTRPSNLPAQLRHVCLLRFSERTMQIVKTHPHATQRHWL